MALLETLMTSVGGAIASASLKLWLKDTSLNEDEVSEAAITKTAEVLIKAIPDAIKRKKTKNRFEEIGDKSAESVLKLVKKEFADVPDDRLEVIASAAGTTIVNTPINVRTLVKRNLSSDELLTFFLERTGAQGGNPSLAGKDSTGNPFPEAEQRIYRRILSHASQLIVDVAASFPKFDQEVSKELLQRLSDLAEDVIEGFNRVMADQADAFEADYRNACVREWDKLELYGVDVQENNKRYNLSIAYVTLMVERLSGDPSSDDEEESRDAISAEEALAAHCKLFVRGPAGSGKTTLLQWYAVFAAARHLQGALTATNDCVPFLIKLRDYPDEPLPSPNDFVSIASKAIGSGEPDRWAHDRLKSGNAILLVDGLDEVHEGRRKEVRKWLTDLTEAFPRSRFVVTSRPHAAEEGWLNTEGFVDAELQEMRRQDVHEFIDHWHEAVADGIDGEDEKNVVLGLAPPIKEKLARSSAIMRLATSPLLCALLCALNRQRLKDLPTDRIELYRNCLDMFYRRDEERGIDDRDYISLSSRQKDSLLQDLSWWMIRNRKTTATVAETTQQLSRQFLLLSKPPETESPGDAALKLFLQRLGIVRKLSHNRVDFPHRTFQEFLAAGAAIESDDVGLLVSNAHDDQWREVVVLAAGRMSPAAADALLRKLLERGDKDNVNRHTLYLTAVAALEVIVSDKPDAAGEIRHLVSERLTEIIPPKSVTEAKVLSSAGDLVVAHLPPSRSLRVRAASMCVRTLFLINTPSAIEKLRNEYSIDTRLLVQEEMQRGVRSLGGDHIDLLKDHKVQKVNLAGTNVADLGFLEGNYRLRSLDLSNTKVGNLRALSLCNDIREINLSGTRVSDLGPLSACTELRRVDVSNTGIQDIRFVLHETLECLNCSETNVIWESVFLQKLPKLRQLHLSKTSIRSLQRIAPQTLSYLDVSSSGVFDLKPLRACTLLQHINLSNTMVADISDLAKCPKLRVVDIAYSKVTDISPLAKLEMLSEVNISGLTELRGWEAFTPTRRASVRWRDREVRIRAIEVMAI